MQRTIEQRFAIKFCAGLEKSGTDTLGAIHQWHKLFKNGRESVKDEPCAGWPSTSGTDDNMQRVREVLNSDRRLSMRMIELALIR
ncbi:hypothetical protein NQ318_016175 [Aromia moschata]|uniref:Mos1 transposase HTH domain-containing protein n=1 Tax=Aromia moschata TaxID=1265417 RepID=A0AAV8XYL6_9CUCU|nr:hypothetical protein NQ318_016175 [Aromia moschata]